MEAALKGKIGGLDKQQRAMRNWSMEPIPQVGSKAPNRWGQTPPGLNSLPRPNSLPTPSALPTGWAFGGSLYDNNQNGKKGKNKNQNQQNQKKGKKRGLGD